MPVTETSIASFHNANRSEGSNVLRGELLELFKKAGSHGLTNDELLTEYFKTYTPFADVTVQDKKRTTSKHQAVLAMRRAIELDGLIRVNGSRRSTTSRQTIRSYRYCEGELGELDVLAARIAADDEVVAKAQARLECYWARVEELTGGRV